MAKSPPPEKDPELETQPPAGGHASSAPDQPPSSPTEEAPAPERKLVAIAKMGPQVFRMEWLTETGDHQVNHVHRGALQQIIDAFEDIPPGLPAADREHRERLVSESAWKLAQLPDDSWDLARLKAFAKSAGIGVPKDTDAAALLDAIYH